MLVWVQFFVVFVCVFLYIVNRESQNVYRVSKAGVGRELFVFFVFFDTKGFEVEQRQIYIGVKYVVFMILYS